jgi:hypothetical protein
MQSREVFGRSAPGYLVRRGTLVQRNEYRTSNVPAATVSLSVGGTFDPLLRVCSHARIDVTSHGPENCHPEIVTDTFWPFSNGPQVGASGRLCPHQSVGPLPRNKYTLSTAQSTSRSDSTVIGTENAPEPRWMKDWIPIGVIEIALPLAGVGVEMVMRLTGSGEKGRSHATVRSAATTPTEQPIRMVGMDLIVARRQGLSLPLSRGGYAHAISGTCVLSWDRAVTHSEAL